MSDRNRVVFSEANDEEINDTELSGRNPNEGMQNRIVQGKSNAINTTGAQLIPDDSANASPRSAQYDLESSEGETPRRRQTDLQQTSGQKASMKRPPVAHNPDVSAAAIMDNEEENLRNNAPSQHNPTQPDHDGTEPHLSMTMLDHEVENLDATVGRPSATPLKITGANSGEDDSNSSSSKNQERIIEEADPEFKPRKQVKDFNHTEESFYQLSKPMWLTNQFVNRPGTVLGIVGVILGAIIAFDIAMNYFATTVETNRDFLIWDDIRTIQFDKTMTAQSMLISGGGGAGGAKAPLQSAIDPEWTMFLIYTEKEAELSSTTSTPSGPGTYTGNMWTKQALMAMRDLEAPIRGSPEF